MTPVRATCAQALGMVVRQMDQQYVEMVVATLLKLAAQDKWEVRHASLMGMQHLLAARTVSTICTFCHENFLFMRVHFVDVTYTNA